MLRKSLCFLLFSFIFLLFSCEDPVPQEPEKVKAPEKTIRVNRFILDIMEDAYLWESEMPDIDIKYEFDSKKYFDKLLYVDDKWSSITDDIQGLIDSQEGVETTFGYSLAFGRISNTGNLFAIVRFVYPDTPADDAGLMRGDIILKLNRGDITEDNALDLFDASKISITIGEIKGNSISETSRVINLTAQKLNLNPVLTNNIIEQDNHKIGYLLYAQYITSYNHELDRVFGEFQENGITDLVLDLRYNPGGYLDAAKYMCGSLAPLDIVTGKKTLVTMHYNESWQQYFRQKSPDQIIISFDDKSAVKLGLERLYVLTGRGTASASELTITGLKPYMDVITVGETTVGKYTASVTFKPEDVYKDPSYYKTFDNWGMQPIICRYANALGVTDFKNGFTPDIYVEDDLFSGIQLGDLQEPLLKAAVEDITGRPILAMKRASLPESFKVFKSRTYRFEQFKENLIIPYDDLGF